MIGGARAGRPTLVRRLVARAMAAGPLAAFVVPGQEIARMHGLDLEAAGLRPAASPRQALVLVLIGEVPEGLSRAAAVAYAQMPRPRALLAVGSGAIAPLPAPDVSVDPDQAALALGVARLHQLLPTGAWAPDGAPFDVPAIQAPAEDQAGIMDHGEHGGTPMEMDHSNHRTTDTDMERDLPGQPIGKTAPVPDSGAGYRVLAHDHAGLQATHGDSDAPAPDLAPTNPHAAHRAQGSAPVMSDEMQPDRNGTDEAPDASDGPHAQPVLHTAREAHAPTHRTRPAGAGMAEHQALQGDIPAPPTPQASPSSMDMGGGAMPQMPDHHPMAEPQSAMAGMEMQHGAMSMSHGMDMEMGMGGFMSMVAMTRDLPRSQDGLPMEWVDAPFGPLFCGLPGGLALSLTLDGDTVGTIGVRGGILGRGLEGTWPGPVRSFPDRLARLDPLAPVAYRLLAVRALEGAAGIAPDDAIIRARIGAAERERMASHLGWVASLCALLGAARLGLAAATLQLALLRAPDAQAVVTLGPQLAALATLAVRTPLLARRLRDIGRPGEEHPASHGPVARASGIAQDARMDDPAYRALGFAPIVRHGNDAYARLEVRLAELAQSLDMIAQVRTLDWSAIALPTGASERFTATVETPRGPATLRLALVAGQVREFSLQTPSMTHLGLIKAVAEGHELADALVGVASLDLSPWEIDR